MNPGNSVMIFLQAQEGNGEKERTIDLLLPLKDISIKIDGEVCWLQVINSDGRNEYHMTEDQYNKIIMQLKRPLDPGQIFINCS